MYILSINSDIHKFNKFAIPKSPASDFEQILSIAIKYLDAPVFTTRDVDVAFFIITNKIGPVKRTWSYT